MAFHGDLFSYPLPELLQWLDASRKTGSLQLSWDAVERKLFVLSGQVVGTAAPGLRERIARILALAHLAHGEQVLAAFARMPVVGDVDAAFGEVGLDAHLIQELVRDELFGTIADLTAASSGHFHWTEDSDRSGEDWAPTELSLRELVFESLRWVDEQPDIEKALPLDALTVHAKAKPLPSHQPLFHRIILALCEGGQNLGRLRLSLGVSRSAVTRHIYDLMRAKLVEVEGAPQLEADPVVDMLEKGAVLVKERQYDAASLVFAALLASDPSDRRVREFVRLVHLEHTAALYGELPPLMVPELVRDVEALSRLRPEERQVATLVNGQWDVSTVVLASQMRELDTLKVLSRLQRLGLLRPVVC